MQFIRSRNALLALLAVLALSLPIFAQTTGELRGTVTTDGAPLPGATVTISSPAMQGTRTSVTDSSGYYSFRAIPPGQYSVVVELEGMQTVTKTVKVDIAGTARADAELGLTSVAEAITVTANAPAVIETQQIQTTIESDLVEELPIGRTLIATVNLAPGVTANGVRGNTVISGAPSYDSTYYINGSVVNEVLRGQPLDLFIEDALEETTVLTGAISAEYGRFTGGVVTAVSKSGGNEFSGSIRDSLTNPSWTDSSPLGEEPADTLSETYEGTLGGRFIRDRLWFFAAGRYVEQEQQNFFNESEIGYTTPREQLRLEGKLTGQITPKHTLVGTILDLQDDINNRCLGGGGCWEQRSLAPAEELPQELLSFNYNGILTNSFLVEANYAESQLSFIGSGGQPGGFAEATNLYFANAGGFGGAPSFCGGCDDETRETTALSVKATYYLSTGNFGTHNIVGGVEDFHEKLFSNNHQSGSDFTVWTFADPTRDANNNLLTNIGRNAGFIIYWPILQLSQGNDLSTQSVFLNDRWDLNNNFSFNLGVRYDQNDGEDSFGQPVADDSKFSPRLGVIYDVMGDGRVRLNASYSEYVSKISNGNIGDAASPAGSPSILYWLYRGPTLTNLSSQELLAQIDTWFQSIGGIENRTPGTFLGGGTNGVSTILQEGGLKSPGVEEITLGAAFSIGQSGFIRVDYQDREWNDFYITRVDQSTGTVEDPLVGGEIDLGIQENGDDFKRSYEAILLQGGYRVTPRFNIGGNYTYSKLRGNLQGETGGSGPVSGANGTALYYPEFLSYANAAPVGYLPEDQRHKARLWLAYDLPTPIGNFNFSLLERFDSGTPYSILGSIDVTEEDGCATCRANDGLYVTVPTANPYYFSERGEFRWDDLTATDLAVNYTLPIGPAQLFLQGELLNAFNEDAQIGGNLTVLTARDDASLEYFDPFTETPVEGVHYVKGPNFGQAVTPTSLATAGHYQLPRTYRFSVGLRF